MAITKEMIHNVTVLHTGHLEVQEVTILSEDGEEIARTNHRGVIAPDQEVADVPERIRPARIEAIAHLVVSRVDRTTASKEAAERAAAQAALEATEG